MSDVHPALRNVPTMDDPDVQRARRASLQKGNLPPVLARKERKQSKEEQGEAFRDAVWKRDKGRSRATGKKLTRVHPKRGGSLVPWDEAGEVDHAIPRSVAPDRLYDVSNGILLSKTENRLRKVVCVAQPEFKVFDFTGPDDRSLPQTFTWRDRRTGKVLKTRIG